MARRNKVDCALERAASYKYVQTKGDLLDRKEQDLIILAKEVKKLRKQLDILLELCE